MTDNEMRIAIAEACGWKQVTVRDNGDIIGIPPAISNRVFIGGSNDWAFVPNFPNNLNSMNEAEQVGIKSDDLADSYWRYLNILVGNPMPFESITWRQSLSLIRATARQRAEAFLKTIGKWKDEQ